MKQIVTRSAFLMAFIVMNLAIHAQQRISDGTASVPINTDALLELQSTSKGLLLPRVSLTATDNPAPLAAHVKGMTVYNLANAGSGAIAVSEGYYFNDGTQWVALAAQKKALTTTEMNALVSPAAGTIVYNTSDSSPYFYNGTNWVGMASKTFSIEAAGAAYVTLSSIDLTKTFTLIGKQNALITANFVPQGWSNAGGGNTEGSYQLIIDGTPQDSRRYSTENNGNYNYRYSGTVSWSGPLGPGSHTIIFRVTNTGGTVETNAEDRKLDILVY